MKAVKIILVVFFILIFVLGTVLFVFLKTFEINQYRSYIERQMTSALGRAVQIQGLQLGMRADKGVTLNVQGLSIADDPAFSSDFFLAVDRISLDIDILAFLTQKKIRISQIEIRNPRLRLIRTAEGKINLPESFLPSDKSLAPAASLKDNLLRRIFGFSLVSAAYAAQGKTESSALREESVRSVSRGLFIHAIRIEGGTLIFTDQTHDPPLNISLEGIDLRMEDLSLNRPFPFQFACSLWAEQANIHGHGHALLDQSNNQISLQGIRVETDLSHLQIRKTPFHDLLRENLRLEGTPGGKLQVTVSQMKAGPAGLLDLSAEGQLTDGRVKLEMLGKAFEDIQISFRMTESDLDIQTLSVLYGQGKVAGQGRLNDYLRERNLSYDIRVEDISLAELIPSSLMPVLDETAGPLKFEGKLFGDFGGEGRLEGNDAASLITSLKGEGALKVREGKLRNINLLKFILDKISFIPHLVNLIESGLPEEYKDKLRKGETSIDRVELSVKMQDGTLFVPEAALSADGFLIAANGQLDFDQNLTLEADFYIPQDLSAAMVMAVDALAYLLNEDNQIHIPLTPYQGMLRDLRIYPDVEDVGRQMIGGKGREELRKVIFRALDIEEESPVSQGGTSSSEGSGHGDQYPPQKEPPPEATEGSAEQTIINSILDAILKGDNPF